MADTRILSLENHIEWSSILEKLPLINRDIYYTPEYYRLYEELGDGKAKCFVFEDGEEIALYPFLLNSVNSLGYDLDKDYFDIQGAYGYNGIIASAFDDQFIKGFYLAFNEYCKNENIIAEFTRFNPLLSNHLFSENYLQVIFDRKTIYLDLNNDFNKIFSEFQTTTRKQIRRATNRYKLEVQIFESDVSVLDEFYQIYHESMIRVNAIPYLFFNKSYLKTLIETTQNACFIAYHEKKPIACILSFYNSYYIHGHLGGTLSDNLYMSPFSLLYCEMIKFGQQKGCRYLNVGGGATVDPDDNLLKFKMNFSKTVSGFFVGKKIHNSEIYDEVVNQWSAKSPGKVEQFKNFLLKYRY